MAATNEKLDCNVSGQGIKRWAKISRARLIRRETRSALGKGDYDVPRKTGYNGWVS